MFKTSLDRTVFETQAVVQSILREGDLWDWEFTSVEVGRSYASRRLEHALHLTGIRKVPLIASAITTLVAGVTAGVTWESLQRGLIAGSITLVVALVATALFYYLTDAPKEMDEALRGDLEAGKKQLKEEKSKLVRVATLIVELDSSYQAALAELTEQHTLERSNWQAEKRDLEKLLEDKESDLNRARAHIEKLYLNYRAKHHTKLNEIGELKKQLLVEKSKNSVPDLYGKIKEVYLKRTYDGLYITLRAFIGNRGADTTIQPFVLKFLLNGREYIALEEDDVTDYSILRRIDKPIWASFTREEVAQELTDLSEDNLKPLDRYRHREGWLRFRIPQLVAYMRGEGGELTLEIIDATNRVVPLKVCSPWPQNGEIRLTRALQAEWDEAVERSRQTQSENSASQESGADF